MSVPALIAAGTRSGSGKTSLTVSVICYLIKRKYRVQTFKVGPDYLDPTYLSLFSGRKCYNLDTWMCGEEYVKDLYDNVARDADAAIIEGVMGFYDGPDARSNYGSTADISKKLDVPALLIENTHGTGRSFAATVKGFISFEPGIRIKGVVANNCGSANHKKILQDALDSAGLPPLVGALPPGSLPALPSRHLGLVSASADNINNDTFEAFAQAAEEFLCMDEIIEIFDIKKSKDKKNISASIQPPGKRHRVGLAKDRAFHFYYPDNLRTLEKRGIELVAFSPVNDRKLPDNLDALYIGGGYPEEYAAELSGNISMKKSIRDFAAGDKKIYAECGGLMYLSRGVQTLDGDRFEFTGVLPFWTRMLNKRKRLGYVEVSTNPSSIWGEKPLVLRGHEYHYTEIIENGSNDMMPAYRLNYPEILKNQPEGFVTKNILASYIHLHFASNPEAVKAFLVKGGEKNGW